MANRILRDWTASETIDKLSEGAEIFFTRLIMKADDYGCYYGNPKLLSSALFPLRDYNLDKIIKWRNECARSGVILFYEVSGKEYVKIVNFGQRLRLMNSKFPQPDDSTPPSNDREALTTDSTPPPETKRSRNEVETESETNPKTAEAVPFVDEVLKVWNEWVQFRREKKATLTPTTVKKQIQFLGGRGDPEIIAILNQSMTNGWTGLFELKQQTNGHSKASARTTGPDAIIEPGKDFGIEKGF